MFGRNFFPSAAAGPRSNNGRTVAPVESAISRVTGPFASVSKVVINDGAIRRIFFPRWSFWWQRRIRITIPAPAQGFLRLEQKTPGILQSVRSTAEAE